MMPDPRWGQPPRPLEGGPVRENSSITSGLKHSTRAGLRVLSLPFTRQMTAAEISAPAIIFSPHPDDETLGCGGTIARKRRAGANVEVVYMTDGTASHKGWIPPGQLKDMRHAEAMAACGVLGVPASGVHFLDFPDGSLQQWREQAAERVTAFLSAHRCDQVFIPYAGDTTPDHRATRAIVLAALAGAGLSTIVYEYPVWFWAHWPWTSMTLRGRRDLPAQVAKSMWASMKMMRDLRWVVPIGDVIEQKRTALAQHRTQMERLVPEQTWATLGDVSNGEFVDCFFQPQEVFSRHII